jgi:molybdenum cofactor guanylyltransferase
MRAAGYVLAGGRSTRMGTDKALLLWQGHPLLVHMLRLVESAAVTATVLGPPTRYSAFCDVCWDDLHPGLGPLGGLETALTRTRSDWNLLVSIDIPGVTPDILKTLVHAASRTAADAIVLRDPALPGEPRGQVHPLCAIYHRRCLAVIKESIRNGDLRMMTLLTRLSVDHLDLAEPLENLNSLKDWLRAMAATT